MSLPSAPVKALGKEEIFLKKLKHSLPSVLRLALSKDTLCRVPCPGTRQSFFFVFGLQIFCAALLKHQELLVTIWGFFVAFLYI